MKTLLITSLTAAALALPLAPVLQAQPPELELRFGNRGDRHGPVDPALYKSLNELEKARKHLMEVERGHAGRREAALRATEDAIAQVRGMIA